MPNPSNSNVKDTTTVGVRLRPNEKQRLDAITARLQARAPFVSVTMSDTLRHLISAGLPSEGDAITAPSLGSEEQAA